MWANDMKKLPTFQQSIDNQSGSASEVRNIICAPLFGHLEPHKQAGDPNVPIAVLQLLNKKNMKKITENDLVS
jgi:hypothetical protein